MKLRYIFVLMLVVALFSGGMGWYAGWSYNPAKERSQSDSVILLERIKDVHQLVLQEAHFSEIYDYKDYWLYDLSPFRKKALIRVTAKVISGFDLEKTHIDLDDQNKVITIHEMPPPEILSIDHELDYFDMEEGTFNQFDEVKITELSQGAKNFIKEKALEAGILEEAEKQKLTFLEHIKTTAALMGWQVRLQAPYLKD